MLQRVRSPLSDGFTMVEVLLSAILISITMGSILSMNVRSIHALRASRDASASSQMLQQRIESLRKRGWTEVSSSAGLARLMATATQSEPELSDSNVVETVKVSAPEATSAGPVAAANSFSVRRSHRTVVVEESGDLSQEATLFFEATIVYRDRTGVHRRSLRNIVCRAGLTRFGLYGSVLGRPGSSAPPAP
jgi:Tfp pilus assembly protein PilV